MKPVFYNLFLLCFVFMFFTVFFFFLEFIECCTLDHLAQNTFHILHYAQQNFKKKCRNIQ